eukprot:CAMPEP_0198204216 /NCGR_PEP_ID=MMETSP1445-20131203/7606_1 /TAXON_ID=36898 /ORGANISM="Pyramimonas sp., Strain CCMP2087" /LENGTH=307 /DNA_ID=CAMNT_0043875987 /DNA_START=198 /DNA_END=1118 /DNA_ORIENTATION=+
MEADIPAKREEIGSASDESNPFNLLALPTALLLRIVDRLELPEELAAVSCVCRLLRQLSSDSRRWETFFRQRWAATRTESGKTPDVDSAKRSSWHKQYNSRESSSKAYTGRYYEDDTMYGHTETIRGVRFQPTLDLIASCSADRTVRLWDLKTRRCAQVSKNPHSALIRTVEMDLDLLASGSSDKTVRVWKADYSLPQLFTLSRSYKLKGHIAPVTALATDEQNLYSGSWDQTVRVWSKDSLRRVATFAQDDWVTSLIVRGRRLTTAVGSSVRCFDLETGKCVANLQDVHVGKVQAVEGTQCGRVVF